MENPIDLTKKLEKLGAKMLIIAPRTEQQVTSEALREAKSMIENKSPGYVRNKTPKEKRILPTTEDVFEPEINATYIDQPVGVTGFDEENPKTLAYAVGQMGIKDMKTDIVRIEFVGHYSSKRTLHGAEGTEHIFRFRSKIKDVFGNVRNSVFYPSAPGEHNSGYGGLSTLDDWFKKIRSIETGVSTAEDTKWYADPAKGYFRYSCFVPDKKRKRQL